MVTQQVWHPDTQRLPEWDAKQFGNIKRFTFLLLMEERHPRLVRQGWRFFVAYRFPFRQSQEAVGFGAAHAGLLIAAC